MKKTRSKKSRDTFSLSQRKLTLTATNKLLCIIKLLEPLKGLKVPKCEILDRSDFHYFYTIKPFWVDDFVVKILT